MKYTWRLWIALFLLGSIAAASVWSAVFVNSSADQIEALAGAVIDAAERGDLDAAKRYDTEARQKMQLLNDRIDYTANTFDYNNAELAYRRLWVYAEEGDFKECRAELESLHSALVAMRIADSFDLPNIL